MVSARPTTTLGNTLPASHMLSTTRCQDLGKYLLQDTVCLPATTHGRTNVGELPAGPTTTLGRNISLADASPSTRRHFEIIKNHRHYARWTFVFWCDVGRSYNTAWMTDFGQPLSYCTLPSLRNVHETQAGDLLLLPVVGPCCWKGVSLSYYHCR